MQKIDLNSPEVRQLLRQAGSQYQILDVFGMMADHQIDPLPVGKPIEVEFTINGVEVDLLKYIGKVNERAEASAKYKAICDVYNQLRGDAVFNRLIDKITDFQNNMENEAGDLLSRNFPGEWSASSMAC